MSQLIFPNALPQAQSQLLTLLRESAEIVTSRFGDGRRGGVVCILGPTEEILIKSIFGAPHPEKVDRYRFHSEEKPRRLGTYVDDLLSFQSMDPEHGRYQGGIRLKTSGCLGAISGLPPPVDEAYFAAATARVGWEEEEYFINALQISRNVPLYEEILAILKKFSLK